MGKSNIMPLDHCRRFGWAYGRLALLAPDLATPGRYDLAAQLPMYGWGQLAAQATARGLVPPEAVAEIGTAIAGIPPENLAANAEGQSAFAMGYYLAQAGEPCPAPEFDIAAERRKRGWTQQALAEALGVKQPLIAAWETGKKRPTAETLERVRNALAEG